MYLVYKILCVINMMGELPTSGLKTLVNSFSIPYVAVPLLEIMGLIMGLSSVCLGAHIILGHMPLWQIVFCIACHQFPLLS